MQYTVTLDALYPEMEEATLGQWLVAPGDAVVEGQPVAELITDKVAYEYQSPAAGTLLAQLVAEKSVVPVGTVLAVLGDAGADVDNRAALDAENRRLSEVRETALSAMQLATSAGAAPTAPATPPAVRATPAARRLARERGVDLATLKGTGPGGMISVDDIP